jgi:hypothetical protein
VARQWMELSVKRLKGSFTGEQFAMAQDGGRLLDDIGSHLDYSTWERLLRDNLGTEPIER